MPIPLGLLIGGSAAAGGLLNLFSRKKKKHHTYESFLRDTGYKPRNVAEEIAKLMRMANDEKKSIRSNANQKAAELNLDPVSTNYASEESIDNSLFKGTADIQTQADAEQRAIAMAIAQANAAEPDQESPFHALLAGGLLGAGMGSQVANAITPVATPNVPTTPGNSPVTPTNNFQLPTRTPRSIDAPIDLMPGNDSFGGLEPMDFQRPNTMDLFKPNKRKGRSLSMAGQPSTLKHMSYLNDSELYKLKNLFA